MLKTYNVVGVMSGTSCDGLDIALCDFVKKTSGWHFTIKRGITVGYSPEWKLRLKNASLLSGFDLTVLHHEFGIFIGEQVKRFLKNEKTPIDLIASHGHTIFHQPAKGITLQIGNGAHIAAINTITTVSDFRSLDVALNGQGAPLVPYGDMMLFPEYHYCLNLGGFANISYQWQKKRVAYDICPVNIVLNHYAEKKGMDFDKDGLLASKGNMNMKLFDDLNRLKYYNQKYPKSLGREWVETQFLPIVENNKIPIENKLRTLYEHIAFQVSMAVKSPVVKKTILTGGGAYNKFLVSLIKSKTKQLIILPNDNMINYKEAMIFAFLGLLRFRNEKNCLSSVTGSRHDNYGGVIHLI